MLVGVVCVTALSASLLGVGRAAHARFPPARPVTLNRVALIVLENRSWGQIAGNPRAPYVNSLMRRGALATHYYAITHPSLPNYLALTTGGHRGVGYDCSACRSTARSLANQLEQAHISWRAYFENLRNPLATTIAPGSPYNPHYNPFAYTDGLRAPDPVADVTSFAALGHDLRRRTLPRFAWIAPNIWHDGHTGGLAAMDRYLRGIVPRVLRALGPRGVLFITWDEGRRSDTAGASGRGGGHVPLIALGPAAKPRARVRIRANHYALLRTIEAAFHVRPLGHARAASTPLLSGLLRP